MNPDVTSLPGRRSSGPLGALALALLLGGCSSIGDSLSGDRIDYGSAVQRQTPLDVPPDLTQLARDPRYLPQAGTINASTFDAAQTNPGSVAGVAPGSTERVAPAVLNDMRIERAGSERWLVTPIAPEVLWPQLRAFWEQLGVPLVLDQPELGLMETEWAENRAKIPQDILRRTLGRVLETLYSTGERDKFRVRVERGATGTEVFLSHRRMEEVYNSRDQNTTVWQPVAADPDLEAEMLSRLRLSLAGGSPVIPGTAASSPAGSASAAIAAAAVDPAAPPTTTGNRARVLSGQPGAALQVDESFDRAWRRVGLALDRGGFTVEDRDRSGGLYFVRYVDPADAGKEEPGFFGRLFGADKDGPTGPLRYRISVKSQGEATTVSVLDAQGAPESGPNGQRIVSRLVQDLR